VISRDSKGFSLIELLIVVAIILIIAAIAIPNLLRSRIAANQASAIGSIRVINTAEVTYSSSYGRGFSSTLAELGPPASGPVSSSAAGLIDSVLASGTKSGYNFTYSPTLPDAGGRYNGYDLNANPAVFGQTGSAYYFTNQTHVIRGNMTGPASASDSPVAN
jgi:prepilin-type N-terminal cleavage/methylation domain-containing protein